MAYWVAQQAFYDKQLSNYVGLSTKTSFAVYQARLAIVSQILACSWYAFLSNTLGLSKLYSLDGYTLSFSLEHGVGDLLENTTNPTTPLSYQIKRLVQVKKHSNLACFIVNSQTFVNCCARSPIDIPLELRYITLKALLLVLLGRNDCTWRTRKGSISFDVFTFLKHDCFS